MRYGRYGLSYLFLRWGLGLTFIYIGLDIFIHPDLWIGYMPTTVPGGLTRDTTLRAAGLFDLALGTLLIVRFIPKLVGMLATLHILGVLVMQGLDAGLVRDVGLLGTAMAIWFWPARHHRRKIFVGWLRKKKKHDEE